MIEHKILLHYPCRDNVKDEWLIIYIPKSRAEYAKDIIELVKKHLEAPLTYGENDEAYGDLPIVLNSRLVTLRGITDCSFAVKETNDTIVNVGF